MSPTIRLPYSAYCVTLVCGFAPMAQGAGSERLCLEAIQQVSRTSGVPQEILLAVAITESGRQGENGPEPWPWALNQGGKSMWFESQAAALAGLDTVLASGATNIDIGCFQLNWRWHSDGFPSAMAMIDPQSNAEYAAAFLTRLKQQTGSWDKAVAGYHSFTPELAARYMDRFRPIYASLQGSITEVTSVAEVPDRVNNYPLLQMGSVQSAGSLVTVSGIARPLFGAP